jgi:hypothetical protein
MPLISVHERVISAPEGASSIQSDEDLRPAFDYLDTR